MLATPEARARRSGSKAVPALQTPEPTATRRFRAMLHAKMSAMLDEPC